MYGGFDPAVTNVYFTHGSLDPWHRMGVLKDLNKHSPSTVIPGLIRLLKSFYFSFIIYQFQRKHSFIHRYIALPRFGIDRL